MLPDTKANAANIGIVLPQTLSAQFTLLERVIKMLSDAKKAGELDQWVAKVRQEVLIDQIGCSVKVADDYITAALERI